jgi:GT2 family glycosyltransferase
MDISIIIVNYNTSELVVECINSIYKFTKNIQFEVIVIDNASKDQSISQVNALYPEATLVFNKKNTGFGSANNQGIRMSKGKYMFLLNPDTLLTSDALASFFTYMEKECNHDVACCGAELIGEDGSKQVSYGNFPTLLEAISVLGPGIFYKNYYKRKISSGVKVYKTINHHVDYISGAALFIRKSVLNELGIFDEDFFLYFEETELAYRIWLKGYLSVIIPSVKIVHFGGRAHPPDQYLLRHKMFADSRVLFFKKCYGSISAFMVKWLYRLR